MALAIGLLASLPLHAQDTSPLDGGFAPNIGHHVVASSGFEVLQPDGKILCAKAGVRYNPDGSRDAVFTAPKYPNVAKSVCVAPDGKIVIMSQELNGAGTTIVQFNSDGSLDRLLAATAQLFSIAMQPDGKILVFPLPSLVNFEIDGVRRNDIARLNRDGSLDTTFDSGGPAVGQDGIYYCYALQPDGKILVGGGFGNFHGSQRARLARLNANGSVDLTFAAPSDLGATPSRVFAAPNGKIYLAINSGNTATPARLLRLNSNGSLDATLGTAGGGDSNTFDEINAFAAQPDGRVLFGGTFANFKGVPRRHLARLNVDGSLDTTFSASAAELKTIQRIAVQPDGKILFAESDTSSEMFRLHADGSLDNSNASVSPRSYLTPPAYVTSAQQADGRIVVVGDFDMVGGVARPGIARLRANGTIDPSFVTAGEFSTNVSFSDPSSWRVAVQSDNSILVVGPFSAVGPSPRSGFARFLPDGSLDRVPNLLFPNTNTFPFPPVKAVAAMPDGRIVIGGDFSTVSLVSRGNLAVLRPDGSVDTSFGPSVSTDGVVRIIMPRTGGGLLVAGTFQNIGGQPRPGLAAITVNGTVDPTFVPTQTAGEITALAPLPDGGAYVGSQSPAGFTGFSRAQLKRLKSTGEVDPTFAFPLEVNATFTALLPDPQGRLLAAFSATETHTTGISTVALESHHYLLRFGRNGAIDPSFSLGTGPSAAITSLVASPDGSVLATGASTSIDDLPVSPGLMRIKPDSATASTPSPILNLSTLGQAGANDSVLTAGFVIKGTASKTVLLRAVGPSLGTFGISSATANPSLTVYAPTLIASNDDWARLTPPSRFLAGEDFGFNVSLASARVGAFALSSQNDAAMVVTLTPGAYTAQVGGGSSQNPGFSLIEIYDLNALPADRRLVNISTRGLVSAGGRSLVAGFVIGGTAPKAILIRGIGPALAPLGVAGVLTDPKLELYFGSNKFDENDNWGGSAILANAFASVGAFPLSATSKDAALLVSLAPGNYTAIVSGANGSSGVALVEVYEVP